MGPSKEQGKVSSRVQNILTDEKKLPADQSSDDASSASESEDKSKTHDVRGRRIGNRFWKNDKKKFSSMVATRGLRLMTWDKKQKLKAELKHAKDLTKAIKEERARAKQALRERRKENIKRREENAKKAEVVQVIKNSAKLKRLKKKQLRSIEKRDTTGMV